MGNAIGNIPTSGQVVQYERSACFVDNNCKYEEFCGSYLKIDGGKAKKLIGKENYEESSTYAIVSAPGYGLSCLAKAEACTKRRNCWIIPMEASKASRLIGKAMKIITLA